jgi:hypothetical protein
MAQQALPAGAIRRRTAFGLLDADGWTWATIKATFWFGLIIFLLGYVPDRAYYFTVSPTIDLGYNAIPIVNLCPATNEGLPCPAPAGAVVPWQDNPAELALPTARTGGGVFTSGENVYLIGGTSGGAATASVLSNVVNEGSFGQTWSEGPALPEPRANATVANLSGVPYVIGGLDAAGAPTNTVFQGIVEEGLLTGWEPASEELALPVAVSEAAGAASATSLFIFGGRTADGLSTTVYRAEIPEGESELEPWVEMTEVPLPEARAGATAASAGSAMYVIGGESPNGVTNSVFYLGLATDGAAAVDPSTGRPFGWGVSVNQSASAALPEPRVGHTTFVNSGAIYAIGGRDANGNPAATNFWTVPSSTDSTIGGWQRLDQTDLPAPRSNTAAAAVGSTVFLIGGTDANGQELNTMARADLAPQPPFFRLGLFGVTVPALGIEGEIGQQLGYIIAASAALGNFVILIVVAWMFSHKRQSFRFFEWITRGRFRAPREDEYVY